MPVIFRDISTSRCGCLPETIATDIFNGVSSSGVTASWDAEASEVGDDSPTLAEPAVPTFMARAFVAASIEVSMDANIGQQVAPLLLDAKTQLEAASVKGSGAGQPTGVVTGSPLGRRWLPLRPTRSLSRT